MSSTEILNRSDRCDKCGAQAYFRVIFTSGSELDFCKHHFDRYKDNFGDNVFAIEDDSRELVST